MSLPEIVLDDRRFQELVSEARMRISQACPEWTEHNASDPGITLIELFAWMTDMLVYRLNRVPDKLHVALLELLGIRLAAPAAATAQLRFRLAAPAKDAVSIPAGTEAGTVRTPNEPAIVFQTRQDFTIPPACPAAYLVQRGGEIEDVGVAGGHARPGAADRLPFATPPAVGDALLLGFAEPLDRLVMRVDVEASQARGAGVDPDDPPLRWEVSGADGRWLEAGVLVDRTGGFNYGSGTLELELPPGSTSTTVAGHRMHWLRCRVDELTRSGAQAPRFSHPPEIYALTAAPIGALLPTIHAASEQDQALGESDGTPGQTFRLRHRPILTLASGETLEVREAAGASWTAWDGQESFAFSTARDRHFVLDPADGEISLGPSIREADGSWTQYGAVPPKGSALRFTRYRHGGGRSGNVIADKLSVLKTTIPGIASVTNPLPADGGIDQESLASARLRASMEFRTRHRAVTARDYEFLAGEASVGVGRVICVPPEAGGAVRVHVLSRIEPADRRLELRELEPHHDLLAEVGAYLDERRVLGARVELLPVRLRGVSVVVNVESPDRSDLQRVQQDVDYALYTYLNPLVGGRQDGPGYGWEFGRGLNHGELHGIVQSVEGVDYVKLLRVYLTDLTTGKREGKPAEGQISIEADALIASGEHVVKAEHPER
ncbi:MAG: putative baseplate assembly protein [Solirubrobacterales bacterium]